VHTASANVWEAYGIVVDTTYWPVLVQRLPVEFQSHDAAIDAWIDTVEAVMRARPEPFVIVADALAMRRAPDAHARRRMAAWMSGSEAYRARCLGIVSIVRSPIVRGTLLAIQWLTHPWPPRPVVTNWSEALAEALHLLRRADVATPRGLEHLASASA